MLINKAMIEIPPRFAGIPPVHPDTNERTTWQRAQGLAADVEIYGKWMRSQAIRRIGHLYPDATGPDGEKLTPIAWIWARTVESPDPSWSGHVPLVGSWTLVRKPGKPQVWIEPIIDHQAQTISYEIREGGEPSYAESCSGGNGTCLATGAAIPTSYIKTESRAGRTRHDLIAVVAEGNGIRHYCSPRPADSRAAAEAQPRWRPEASLPDKGLGFRVQAYGLGEWWKLFTARQLTVLTTFSDLLDEVADKVIADALASGMAGDEKRLRDGGNGAAAYADAVVTYLALVVDRLADRNSTLCSWDVSRQHARNVFARQTISMTWDFTENNPLGASSGSWLNYLSGLVRAIERLPASRAGTVVQRDARAHVAESVGAVISTDPPYYDNVGYADISDFFYVWMRENLLKTWPDELSTLLTPKADELIADPGRHGGSVGAKRHFESGMAEFMETLATSVSHEIPATVYYAYKATETKDGEIRSTGWDTFLQAVVDAGLQVNATWPLRTELANRPRGIGSNALASSIVLACRPRSESAAPATRGEFIAALRQELPEAVRVLQSGDIRPVDMAQSTIGPGIKVFSRYGQVVEADGSPMRVSAALGIINDVLGEVLDGTEADLDADTRFALTWFAEHGYNAGPSGDADSVARAKNTSLAGIEASGVGEARAGEFRLYERTELDPDWLPAEDSRRTVWEATQYMAAALERSESEAADLLYALGGDGDRARQLAYLLYQTANDRGWASEAGAYDALIAAWPSLRVGAARVAATVAAEAVGPVQQVLL